MANRSWLFVPGDSEAKLARAPGVGADVVIVDLEDAVAPEAKPRARELAAGWLKAHRQQVVAERGFARWVRINSLDSRLWRDDLLAVLPGTPDGIMLPKSAGPEAVQQLAAELYEHEQRSGVTPGSTRILPLVSETAAAALTIPAYVPASLPRLAGLTWGAEDLSAVLGATRKRGDDGNWTDAFRFARLQTLLAAHAKGVMAIETLHADFADEAGLKRMAEAARADGFTGMLAIHPAQVAVINAAFTPSEAELEAARAVVASFAANPGAGALQIDRRMIDRPHLQAALRLLGIEE